MKCNVTYITSSESVVCGEFKTKKKRKNAGVHVDWAGDCAPAAACASPRGLLGSGGSGPLLRILRALFGLRVQLLQQGLGILHLHRTQI